MSSQTTEDDLAATRTSLRRMIKNQTAELGAYATDEQVASSRYRVHPGIRLGLLCFGFS
jgi:hypothetical protein